MGCLQQAPPIGGVGALDEERVLAQAGVQLARQEDLGEFHRQPGKIAQALLGQHAQPAFLFGDLAGRPFERRQTQPAIMGHGTTAPTPGRWGLG